MLVASTTLLTTLSGWVVVVGAISSNIATSSQCSSTTVEAHSTKSTSKTTQPFPCPAQVPSSREITLVDMQMVDDFQAARSRFCWTSRRSDMLCDVLGDGWW